MIKKAEQSERKPAVPKQTPTIKTKKKVKKSAKKAIDDFEDFGVKQIELSNQNERETPKGDLNEYLAEALAKAKPAESMLE